MDNLLTYSYMPYFDKTGPMGQGAKSGRGLGQCADGTPSADPGVFRRGCGRGCGCGRGYGRGRGLGLMDQNAQNLSLDQEEAFLESRLEAIRLAKQTPSQS